MADGQPVVPRRGRDDAPAPFIIGERPELVERAPELERAGRLVALPFNVNIRAELPAERTGALERRPPDIGFDPLVGRPDLTREIDHPFVHGKPPPLTIAQLFMTCPRQANCEMSAPGVE